MRNKQDTREKSRKTVRQRNLSHVLFLQKHSLSFSVSWFVSSSFHICPL